MTPREQRGLVIAATKRIKEQNGKWLVPSSENAARKYTVCPNESHCSCTCPDFEDRGCECKHIYAVRFVIQRDFLDDGSEVETRQVTVTEVRKTYSQNWGAYNAAQTTEKAVVQRLLADLCKSIPESTETRLGRPRLPLRDGVFCAVFKVFSMLSSRRFTSDLCDAHAKGYISRVPHFNSVLNVLDNEETTPILKALVAKSAEPLAALESQFAIDSTGFSGSRFDRWFDEKYGHIERRSIARSWVKAHAVIGTVTNCVTAVEVTENNSHDGTFLPSLLNETAQRFKVGELSADKAYLSENNLAVVASIDAKAYIPFKVNNAPTRAGVWNTAYHYFHLHREEFLQHYHRRSNAESTFSAIKRKFGDSVKAKNKTAMVNETLAKFICHNLACLVQSIEEFGIDVDFGCTKTIKPAQQSFEI
jgi:transposase